MANQTKYFKTPFAESGTRAEVPNNSVGGAVGFDTGFGPDYELPQGSAGRKRIERDKYNGLHHSITKNLKQWQENLYPTWIEDNGSGAAFSYPQGMIVNHSGFNWVSNETENQEEPGAGLKWSKHVEDYDAFTAALLAEAGAVDDGLPDTLGNSKRVDALNELYGKNLVKVGDFITGGIAENERQCFKFSDGFYYRNVSLSYPVTVITGSAPDEDWACVGLLINSYPVYSPDNFGYNMGDDAYYSFQKCFDSMPFGGDFNLIAGQVYTFKSQPAKIRRPGNYRGQGLFHNLPTNQHHAQIVNATNGLVIEIAFYWSTPGWKEGGQYNRVIEGFKAKGNKTAYPLSGFLAGPASQGSTVVRQNYIEGMGFGICPLTSYGMIIEQNVIRNCETAITANPAKYAPTGPATPEGPSKEFWQTNNIRIRDNLLTDNDYGVDFNCPGNSITCNNNVSERQLVNFWFSSMVGHPVGFDGRVLRGLEVNGNYLEAGSVAHIIVGRNSADGLPASAPISVQCLTNQINGDGTPDADGLIVLLAAQDADFDNSFRNRTTSKIMYDLGQGNCAHTRVRFSSGETHKGYFNRFGSNKMKFGDISATRSGSLFTLHVNAGDANKVAISQCFDINAGTETKPFADIPAAVDMLRCFSNELLKNNINTVNLVCTGEVGSLRSPPLPIRTISYSLGGATPTTINGMANVSTGRHVISGAFKLTNADKATVAPWSCFDTDLSINGASFEFTGYPVGTVLIKANRLSQVSLVNCTTTNQLPVASDASIILLASPSLTATHVKTNGGQIFQ